MRIYRRDRGCGRPVVLLHGEVVSGANQNRSGVTERLTASNRVIIFDRHGFGHSERPRGRPWTAAEQANLIHAALVKLEVSRPVIVSHSWGTLVFLAFAERHPASAAGLVSLSGYYLPTLHLEALLVVPAA